jgi:hypothetical protein
MRAAVEQAEKFAVQIEYRDRAASHRYQLSLARRNLAHRRNHVLAHAVSSTLDRFLSIRCRRYIPAGPAATEQP